MSLAQFSLVIAFVVIAINFINWRLINTNKRAVKAVCWLLHAALLALTVLTAKHYLLCPQ